MKAVLYARVSLSTGEQTTQQQVDGLRAYAERQGWEIVAVLQDEAGATNHRKRAAWHQALGMIASGEADVLAVWRLDRAFRSLSDAANVAEMMKAKGASLVSVTEGFDMGTPAGEMMFGMLAVCAAFERRVLIERTRAGMARVKRYGTKSGRPVGRPVGWRKGVAA